MYYWNPHGRGGLCSWKSSWPLPRTGLSGYVQISSFLQLLTVVVEVLVEVFTRGGISQGQGSTPFCEAEHVDISVPHGRGKLGDGVFSSPSAGAADEGPAVRGSGMGKAGSTGYDAPCGSSSCGQAGFAGEDAPRGSSSRGKAGSTGDDAPRVPLGARSGVGRQRPRPGQGSTALRGRRFVGQVFVEPDAAGSVGFLESVSAQAELAFEGDFRFSASYRGRFADGDYVWFSARQLPTGRWEAFDLVHF